MLDSETQKRSCVFVSFCRSEVDSSNHASWTSSNIADVCFTSLETSPQSQSSPDLTGVTSQGSVEETATELLNSQDAFFPALINCNHPIECVAPRLTTHVMWWVWISPFCVNWNAIIIRVLLVLWCVRAHSSNSLHLLYGPVPGPYPRTQEHEADLWPLLSLHLNGMVLGHEDLFHYTSAWF